MDLDALAPRSPRGGRAARLGPLKVIEHQEERALPGHRLDDDEKPSRSPRRDDASGKPEGLNDTIGDKRTAIFILY